MVVFGKSRRGFWWKMVPKDKNLGDITATADVYFDLLILRTKIIKDTVTSVVNWRTVALTKTMNIAQSVTSMGLFKVEVTRCKYKDQVLFDQ